MDAPLSPFARRRRRRAARAGEFVLLLVLGVRLAGGLVRGFSAAPPDARGPPEAIALSLSTASFRELQWLPGVGPARAAAILRARPAGGVAWTWGEVARVHGIGPVTIARLRALAGVEP